MSTENLCENTEDIDEFIVFELTKDSDSMAGDDYPHEEEIIEEIEDDDIDTDTVLVLEEEKDQKPFIEERLDDDQPEDDGHATEPVIIKTQKLSPAPPTPKKTSSSPTRYLLFDELVATIVDYDEENTPIVEFAISGTEADERLPVECGICPDVMHKSKLAKHLKSHLVDGTKRYACIYCDETYKDYKYLAGHARRHMGIRPYVCEICKLYFSTKQDLRVHNQRRHHAKDLICEICGKSFSQNTMLKRHREATHEKKLRFQCDHCPKAYYKNFALQEHVRNVHMGQRRMLSCPFCGMQCRDAHKMARHRKELHLNQTNFQCIICQEEFTNINYFDAHKRSIQCRNNTRRHVEEKQVELKHEQQEQNAMTIGMDEEEAQLLDHTDAEFQCLMGDDLVYEITLENDEEDEN